MSASAGRVLIIPKGDYSASVTYGNLDMVYYGGKSYICKKTSLNNLPTDTEYWQLMAEGVAGSYYGTCSTAAATAEKAVTVSADQHFALFKGATITVKFTTTNTATNPTINVNGTGAASVVYGSGVITTGTLSYAGTANYSMTYVYDGTHWCWVSSGADANTTYSPQKLGIGYGTCSTAAATAEKAVTLSGYELVTNGTIAVKFTNAVPASATLKVNNKTAKAIYYRGSAITAGIINAGDTATLFYNGSQYHVVAVDNVEKPAFTEAQTRANIASGETLPTILGKIKKFFTDLKAIAFSGSATDVDYDSNTTVKDAIDAKVNTTDLNYAFGTPNFHLRTNYDANLTDVNNCPNGVCSATFSQHTPSGSAESLYVFSMPVDNNSDYCRQIAWSMSTRYIYTRDCYAGNWTAWTQLISMNQRRNVSVTPDVNGNVAFLSASVGIPICCVVHNSDVYPSAPFSGSGGSAWWINVKNASGQPITTGISISFVYIPL